MLSIYVVGFLGQKNQSGEVWRGISSEWTAGKETRCYGKTQYWSFKDRCELFRVSVSRLNQWLMDTFVLPFQLSKMIFLVAVNVSKANVWRCFGIVSEERSPNRDAEAEDKNSVLSDIRAPLRCNLHCADQSLLSTKLTYLNKHKGKL